MLLLAVIECAITRYLIKWSGTVIPFWGTAGAQQDRNDGADQRRSLSLVFKNNVLNQELVCRFGQTIDTPVV